MNNTDDRKNAARNAVRDAIARGISPQELIEAAEESLRVIKPISDDIADRAKGAGAVPDDEPGALAMQAVTVNPQESGDVKEALMQSILDDGGFDITMAFTERGYEHREHRIPKNCIDSQQLTNSFNSFARSRDWVDGNTADEIIVIHTPPATTTYRSVLIPGNKGGLFGIGKTEDSHTNVVSGRIPRLHSEFMVNGKKEPMTVVLYLVPTRNDWVVPDGRAGQFLALEMRLPSSIATKLEEILKTDPKFIRTVVESIMVKTFGIPKLLQGRGVSSTPPPWEAEHAKMLIVKGRDMQNIDV